MTEFPTTSFPVDVVRSTRRKKTVQARLSQGRIKVMVPADLPPAEEARVVQELTARITRKQKSIQVDLETRAKRLAKTYALPTPETIVWSNRQNMRWGSCTPTQKRIRISNRLASMPDWVLDYVIVHELAHLEEAGHGPRFEKLASRYELAERARGYLLARAED